MPGLFFNSGIDDGFEQDLKRMNAQMNSFAGNVEQQNQQMASSFKMLGGAVAAYFTVDALTNFARQLVTVRGEFEKLGVAFETMLGNQEAANKLMADITDLAAKTPFSLTEVAQGAKQLLAFGENSETVIDTLRRMGDIAAGTGTDIGGLNLAYGQVMTKGKLQAQEMYQFAERGVPIIQELAKVMGVTKAEVTKLVEQGQVGFPIVQKALNNLTNEGGIFFNLMEKQSKTISGMIGNLGDAFDRMLNEMGQSSEGFLKGTVQALTSVVENWDEVLKVIKLLVGAYGAYKAAVITTIAWEKAKAASAVQAALAGRSLTTWEIIHTTVLYKLNAAQKTVNTTMKANPYGLVLAAITAVIGALVLWSDETDDLKGKHDDFSKVLGDEQSKMSSLFEATKNANIGSEERKKLIDEINTQYGTYLPNLLTETTSNEELAAAQKLVNDELIKNIALKSRQDELSAATKGLLDKEKQTYQDLIDELSDPRLAAGLFAGIKKAAEDMAKDPIMNEFITGQRAGFLETPEIKRLADAYGLTTKQVYQQIQSLGIAKNQYKTALSEIGQFYDQFIKGIQSSVAPKAKAKDGQLVDVDSIKKLKDELAKLENQRETATSINDKAELDRLAALIIAKQKQIDSFAIKKDKSKINESALKALEIENQTRINQITDQYGREEKLQKEFQIKMLENELTYLNAKSKLTVDPLEKLKIEENIIKTQSELKRATEDKTLSDLLAQYLTYTEQRKKIEEKYQKEINLLNAAGQFQKAEVAKQAMEKELDAVDEALLSMNKSYQTWLESTLPGIVKDGAETIQDQLKTLNTQFADNLIGGDPEALVVLKAKITALEKELQKLRNKNDDSNKSFADSIQLINEMNELLDGLADAFAGTNEETRNIVNGITGAVSGLLGMANAIKAVGKATSTLEKASGIIAVISLAVKVFASINEAMNKNAQLRTEKYIKQLEVQQQINSALIEQIKLYKEGNELFSDDKWGTALSGLQAYNQALKANDTLLQGINDNWKTNWKLSAGIGGFGEGNRLAEIRDEAAKTGDALQQALAGVAVKTKDRSGFANFFGAQDQFKSLLELYPGLIKANGQLDAALLQTAVDSENLNDVDKARLNSLIDLTKQAEQAYAQFGEYISSIFGNVADDITQAFQVMYEGGDDAMTSLEESFSNMIETFTRDAIEFAFLQPYLNQLNSITKDLGAQYASGNISSKQLQEGIISTLGDFYNSLNRVQPEILQAYKNADQLAAQAGFDAAFNPEQAAAKTADEIVTKSTAGQIQQAITEETGGQLVGRMGAIMLSNERIANFTQDMYDLGVKKLLLMNQIKSNTDYLPQIADNTKKTVEKLSIL